MTSVLNGHTFECLALFVRINAKLFKQSPERSRIDQVSLDSEILAKDAPTSFSEAVLLRPVYRRRCVAIIPDRLVADLHFSHRHSYIYGTATWIAVCHDSRADLRANVGERYIVGE